MKEPVIFDGHNDVLTRLWSEKGGDPARSFAAAGAGAIDLESARAGGFAGGLFAIWVPSPGMTMPDMSGASYDVPMPPRMDQADALAVTFAQARILGDLEAAGHLAICHEAREIRDALSAGRLAAVMHLEGADAIGPDLAELDILYAMGLRSLGLVWSRPTIFAEGVPFRFPSSPDTGPGLTEAGRALVRRCNELAVVIDLSHLNERGFFDVAEISSAPLVASHSNAHALSPHARNLTDPQLAAIRASDGIVGLNFAVAFLRADGQRDTATPVETMLAHLDRLIDAVGEDRVGLGSDYDGAEVPEALRTAASLPVLREAMAAHGYSEARIAKICNGNWLRVLEATWGA